MRQSRTPASLPAHGVRHYTRITLTNGRHLVALLALLPQNQLVTHQRQTGSPSVSTMLELTKND